MLLADATVTVEAWQAVAGGVVTILVIVAAAFWQVPTRWLRGRREWREELAKDAEQRYEAEQEADHRQRESDAVRNAAIQERISQLERDRDDCRKENADMTRVVRRLYKQVAALTKVVHDTEPDTPLATWEKDAGGRYTKFNLRFLKLVDMAGCNPADVQGRTDKEVFGPYTAAVLEAMDRRAALAPDGLVSESGVVIHPKLPPLVVIKQRCLPAVVAPEDSRWVAHCGMAIIVQPWDGAGSGYEIPQSPPSK